MTVPQYIPCPHCGEPLPSRARRCPKCETALSTCEECGGVIPETEMKCRYCGTEYYDDGSPVRHDSPATDWQPPPPAGATAWQPVPPFGPWGPPAVTKPTNALSIVAIICGVISLLLFPIVLGPIGLILAAVAKTRSEPMATPALAIAAIGMIVGMTLGALVGALSAL